jgi:hypothetical protein
MLEKLLEKAVTVKLELTLEMQESLEAAARARGLSLEAYLQQVIQNHEPTTPMVSGEEWDKEFESWIGSFPETNLLSDEAVSRGSMYPDRW